MNCMVWFVATFTKYKGSCVLCSCYTAARHHRTTTALLPLLWDPLRYGDRLCQETPVQRPNRLMFVYRCQYSADCPGHRHGLVIPHLHVHDAAKLSLSDANNNNNSNSKSYNIIASASHHTNTRIPSKLHTIPWYVILQPIVLCFFKDLLVLFAVR